MCPLSALQLLSDQRFRSVKTFFVSCEFHRCQLDLRLFECEARRLSVQNVCDALDLELSPVEREVLAGKAITSPFRVFSGEISRPMPGPSSMPSSMGAVLTFSLELCVEHEPVLLDVGFHKCRLRAADLDNGVGLITCERTLDGQTAQHVADARGRSGTDGNARGSNRTTRAMESFWARLKLRQYNNSLEKRLEQNARKSCVCKWAHGVVSPCTLRRLHGNRNMQQAKTLNIQQIVKMPSIQTTSCPMMVFVQQRTQPVSHRLECATPLHQSPDRFETGLSVPEVRRPVVRDLQAHFFLWNCCHRCCRVWRSAPIVR